MDTYTMTITFKVETDMEANSVACDIEQHALDVLRSVGEVSVSRVSRETVIRDVNGNPKALCRSI